MKTTRDALLDELTQLSVLYPTMRFGQLLEMVATLAGAETVAEMERTSDAQIFQEANELVRERSKQIEVAPITEESLGAERSRLIETLRQNTLLGQESLICSLIHIAGETNTTSYDIEDDVLLQRLNPQNAVA